jgi:hypothetical protein
MPPPDRRQLWRSVLRRTGLDPRRVGHWLRRHRRSEGLRPGPLARQLGVTMKGLILLSLCQTPRDEQFQEDLRVICTRTGADPVALARLLRQEQALERWQGTAPPPQGWLMAASDAEVEPGEGDQPPQEERPP